jgi:glycosyltransferase involved in cell wall biosynthesis
MRDAWALHNALGGIKPLKRAIERLVLRRADHVTTVSKGLAEELHQLYQVKVGVMYNVATHYLDVPPAERIDMQQISPEIDPQRLTLVYTGSTPEHHYDLAALVGALVRLRCEQPTLAARLQVVFVGACDEARREAQTRGLHAPEIVFVSHLPHASARAVQASASALIFLAHHGPNNMGVVSTKLFEYLCLGQPVLPFDLCAGSDVDLLLYRYCGVSVNVHGEAEITELLARVAEQGVMELPRLNNVNRVRELLEDYRHHAEILISK